MHRLRGGGSHCVCVLPDLQRHIDQRNHNGNRADDLSEVGKVVKDHSSDLGARARAPLAKAKNLQAMRLLYNVGVPFTCLSYSPASKWPLDSAIKPALLSC